MGQSKESLRAKQRAYAKAHQRDRTIYMRTYRKERIGKLRTQIFDALGKKCANCGITDQRVLNVDHRHGGGAGHRKGRSSLQYYTDILGDLDSFRILCYNCNWLAHRHGVTF